MTVEVDTAAGIGNGFVRLAIKDALQPQLLIKGGGQFGFALGACLKQMGIDCPIIERNSRVGDNWRNLYHSLTLYNEVTLHSLPHIVFRHDAP